MSVDSSEVLSRKPNSTSERFSSKVEVTLVLFILAGSTIIHVLLIDPTFNGPDARSNFSFAEEGQEWSWWLDPGAFHGYLFPMFYGTFFAVVARFTDGSFFAVQILQICMALLLAIYGWLLTRDISQWTRIMTLLAIAFSPSVFALARMNGYEILLSFLVMSSVVLLWGRGGLPSSFGRRRCILVASVAGLLYGFAMLTQGKVIIILPVLFVLAWKWGKTSALIFSGVAFAPVIAWGIRNYFVISTWNPFNSSSAVVMWLGNNPFTKTGEYTEVIDPPEGQSFYSASLEFVIEQPETAFALMLRRMIRLTEPMYIYLNPGETSPLQLGLHVMFMVLSLIGLLLFLTYLFGRIWVCPPKIPKVGALAAIVVLFFLVHLPFATETRHLKPIVPIALCVIVPTLIQLIHRLYTNLGSFRNPML